MIILYLSIFLFINLIFTGIFTFRKKRKAKIISIILALILFASIIFSGFYSIHLVNKLDKTIWYSDYIDVLDITYDDEGKATGYTDVNNEYHQFKYLSFVKSIPVTVINDETLESEGLSDKYSINPNSLSTGKVIFIQESHLITDRFDDLFVPQTEFPIQLILIELDSEK